MRWPSALACSSDQDRGTDSSRGSALAEVRRGCENFLYCFKAAPRGRSRRRLGTARPSSRSAPARPASGARSAGAKGKDGAAGTQGSHGAAADLTRGPLAAAPSGLCGRPGKAARSRASVQPPPPCQIRRSAGAGLAAVNGFLTVVAAFCLRYQRRWGPVPHLRGGGFDTGGGGCTLARDRAAFPGRPRKPDGAAARGPRVKSAAAP